MSPRTASTSREPTVDAQTWTAGDASKQVPVAGLLAHDPTLHDTVLTPDEWDAKLADYLVSPRS